MLTGLWGVKGKSTRAQFQNWLCYEATSACRKKPPPVPKDRAPGPAFVVQDQKERDLAKMMEGMKVLFPPSFGDMLFIPLLLGDMLFISWVSSPEPLVFGSLGMCVSKSAIHSEHERL
jgi:hypothetical protein